MTGGNSYDVIVAGAGPTGAVLAALLGQAGYRTLVLERDAEVFPLPRAVHMDHEIMRVLQQVGLEHRIPAFAGAVEEYLFQNAQGQNILEIRGGGRLAVSGYSASVMFFQPELESALRRRVTELAAVTARFGAELIGLDLDGDAAEGVTAVFEHDGIVEKARARYLVGCDGASSWVRKRLGVAIEDLGFDEPWVVVDTLVHGDTGLPEETAYQFCDPRRPTTCVPAGPGRRRWEFMLLPGETRERMQEPDRIWSLLERWGGRDALELVRIAVYRFHAVIAAEWRQGPVLLAGDAAHQTPPFMGQGLCSGVRDAANLAWKLDLVLAGRAAPALLDTYQTERAPHVRHIVETSVAMGRIVCELDPAAAAVRDEMLLSARAAGGHGPGESLGDQVAPLTAGILSADDVSAGRLFPQPWVRGGGRDGRLDELVGCGFRLVVDDPALLPAAERLEAAGISPVVLSSDHGGGFVETAEPSALGWLHDRGMHAALVRPDHYVFATASDAAGVQVLVEALSTALAVPG